MKPIDLIEWWLRAAPWSRKANKEISFYSQFLLKKYVAMGIFLKHHSELKRASIRMLTEV